MDKLTANQRLGVDEMLQSKSERYGIIQQRDGNLVAVGADGTPYWHTNTWNHPGASAVIQDDGNFVVYDTDSRPLWASDAFHFGDVPTIASVDPRGYVYVGVARWWRQMCAGLPCCMHLQWPGYATTTVETNIDGEDVVIQLW